MSQSEVKEIIGKERGFSDFVVYVDESGDHSLKSIDKDYPVFVLAFCIFYKDHYLSKIVPELQQLKFDYFGHDLVILHEHEIRKEKGQDSLETHVIVERRGAKEDNELELEFLRICDGTNKYKQDLPFKIRMAAKTSNSAGLQLADLVARPIGRHVINPEQANQAFDLLREKFYCEGGREMVGKGYDQWGLKHFP